MQVTGPVLGGDLGWDDVERDGLRLPARSRHIVSGLADVERFGPGFPDVSFVLDLTGGEPVASDLSLSGPVTTRHLRQLASAWGPVFVRGAYVRTVKVAADLERQPDAVQRAVRARADYDTTRKRRPGRGRDEHLWAEREAIYRAGDAHLEACERCRRRLEDPAVELHGRPRQPGNRALYVHNYPVDLQTVRNWTIIIRRNMVGGGQP